MGRLASDSVSPTDAAAWDRASFGKPKADLEVGVDVTGKVVFVTVHGGREVSRVSAEYGQVDTKLAVLDVSAWSLHIMTPHADGSPVEPISCTSWVSAAEAAIAHLGPVDLWKDTRDATFPPVSRVGEFR